MANLVVHTISVVAMKSFFLLLGFLLMNGAVSRSRHMLDILHDQLNQAKKEDTTRVLALCSLADYYGFIQSDSCFYYASQSARLSEKLKYTYGEYWAYLATFHGFNTQGNYPKALQAALDYLKTAEELKNERPEVIVAGLLYHGTIEPGDGEFRRSKNYSFIKTSNGRNNIGQPMEEVYACYSQMGIVFSALKHPDSALWYATKRIMISDYIPINIKNILHWRSEP